MDTYHMLAAEPFLRGMTDHELERLSICARRSFLHAGSRLFREGGRADRFWIISAGQVAVDTHVPGSGDVVVEVLGPHAVLGWSWMFPPYRWHFGAVAVERTLAIELDGPGVRELCEKDSSIGYALTSRFMPVVVERLQATRERLLKLDRGLLVPEPRLG